LTFIYPQEVHKVIHKTTYPQAYLYFENESGFQYPARRPPAALQPRPQDAPQTL
jgi:hypothetical protein